MLIWGTVGLAVGGPQPGKRRKGRKSTTRSRREVKAWAFRKNFRLVLPACRFWLADRRPEAREIQEVDDTLSPELDGHALDSRRASRRWLRRRARIVTLRPSSADHVLFRNAILEQSIDERRSSFGG